MRAELANLNHCAEQFLSRAAANLYWYCNRGKATLGEVESQHNRVWSLGIYCDFVHLSKNQKLEIVLHRIGCIKLLIDIRTLKGKDRTIYYVLSYQLKSIKMRAKLANLNDCVAPFLSRATANLCWYYYRIGCVFKKVPDSRTNLKDNGAHRLIWNCFQ